MKIVDAIVLVLFVVGLIVLCFFQQCSLDIFFLVFGFAVALMCGIALYRVNRKPKTHKDEWSEQ